MGCLYAKVHWHSNILEVPSVTFRPYLTQSDWDLPEEVNATPVEAPTAPRLVRELVISLFSGPNSTSPTGSCTVRYIEAAMQRMTNLRVVNICFISR
jgi:hypothetical protein